MTKDVTYCNVFAHDIDELRQGQLLLACVARLEQWPTRSTRLRACVDVNGGHFEHIPCDCQFVFSALDELYFSHHA